MTGRKLKSLQELEEHGEPMVKIAKVKPKPKAKNMVTVTKTTPKANTFTVSGRHTGRMAQKISKKEDSDKKDKKDDDSLKPMVH